MDPAHKVTEEELIRIARIRGDFFYLFMEEASELCHKYGAEFTTMLRESYTDPVLSHCQDEFTWWTMPKIVLDWQKTVDLVDFVLIKDYVQRNEDVKKNALVNKEYAQKQGKDVWIQCYDEQGGNFNETWMKNAINDDTVTGFILYELSHVNDYYYAGLKDLLEGVGFKVTFREDRISSK